MKMTIKDQRLLIRYAQMLRTTFRNEKKFCWTCAFIWTSCKSREVSVQKWARWVLNRRLNLTPDTFI